MFTQHLSTFLDPKLPKINRSLSAAGSLIEKDLMCYFRKRLQQFEDIEKHFEMSWYIGNTLTYELNLEATYTRCLLVSFTVPSACPHVACLETNAKSWNNVLISNYFPRHTCFWQSACTVDLLYLTLLCFILCVILFTVLQ